MITYCGITLETCFSQNVFGTHLCTSSLIPSSNNMKLKYISKYIEDKNKWKYKYKQKGKYKYTPVACSLILASHSIKLKHISAIYLLLYV